MLRIVLNDNDGGQRLDKFLQKTVRALPPSLMYKYIRTKRIKVNGRRAALNMRLEAGDVVEMYIPDEFSADAPLSSSESLAREKRRPEIVFEDENIIICDKRPGMLSHAGDAYEAHSAEHNDRDTLIFIIQAYLAAKGEYCPEEETSFAPALCNRIDRNTGGLVIAAKNAAALREMNRIIREGLVEKKYLCAVHGEPKPAAATLRAYLAKNSRTKTVSVTDRPTPASKEIITSYKTLEVNREMKLSLLEVTLGTGRTHQIRAQLAHIGHPLLGEGKYAENRADRALGYTSQALYSYKITFGEFAGCLSALSKKSFEAARENIRFLGLFKGL